MARKLRTQRKVQIRKGSRSFTPNLSNTYGIKGSSGGSDMSGRSSAAKGAVTMRKPADKTGKRAKGLIQGKGDI